MLLEYKIYNKEKQKDLLAGVVVIWKDKILLVKPKKFKNIMKGWSIPKGHVENNDVLQSALDELKDESTLVLDKETLLKSPKDRVVYFKKGIKKELIFYIVKIKKKDIGVKLFNNMILGNFLKKKGETREAGFFSRDDAKKLIEPKQKDILKYL